MPAPSDPQLWLGVLPSLAPRLEPPRAASVAISLRDEFDAVSRKGLRVPRPKIPG